MQDHQLIQVEVTKYGYGDMPYQGVEMRCTCGKRYMDEEAMYRHRVDILWGSYINNNHGKHQPVALAEVTA